LNKNIVNVRSHDTSVKRCSCGMWEDLYDHYLPFSAIAGICWNSIRHINGCIFCINVKVIITQILHRREYSGTAICSLDATWWLQRAESFGMFWIFFGWTAQ